MAENTGTSGNDTFTNLDGAGSLTLVLAASQAEGVWPIIDILVDGNVVRSGISIRADNATGATQSVAVAVPAGATAFGIHYKNDSQTDYVTADRNVYIKSIALNGVEFDPATASYALEYGDGTYARTEDGRAKMDVGGTLTFSGSAVTSAAGAASGGTNDTFNGLAGMDTVVYSGGHAEYGVIRTSTGWSVTHGSEADALVSVERLQFSDHKVALDVDGNAGWAIKIISALFGAQWAASPSIVGVGISLLDSGMSPQAVIQAVVNNAGFSSLSGSNETFVRTVYQNLTGSTASEQFVDNVVNLIDSGQHSKESIGLIAAGLVGVPDAGIIYA